MTKLEYKEESSKVLFDYYSVCLHYLNEGLFDEYDANEILKELEDAELYLECAGLLRAINEYKAIKDKEFSELRIDISGKND